MNRTAARCGVFTALVMFVVSALTVAEQRGAATKTRAARELTRVDNVSPTISKVLAENKQKDTGQLAVSEEDGRFLRLMVASRGVKRALEIGGASGYSAIWIGEGLRLTGGRLVTLEYDAARAKELSDNIRRAGLSDIVAPGSTWTISEPQRHEQAR